MAEEGAAAPTANPQLLSRVERLPRGNFTNRQKPNLARQEFLGGLLNEDLPTLVAWHHDRPEHEQKRLLKTLNNLYTSYKDIGARRQQEGEGELLAGGSDPLEIAGNQLGKSESAPEIAKPQLKPINVFEEKRRKGITERRRRGSVSENSLQRWLEQESNASTAAGTETTLASSWTGVSSMTKTSLGSSAFSAPTTTTKMAYKRHSRALAVNRRKWATRKAHEPGVLEDGLPTDNYPDERRLRTTMAGFFGQRPVGVGISPKMWENVFQEQNHPFIGQHLAEAAPEERESFAGMVRALQNLRRIRHFSTAYERQYDAYENERLWKPPVEKATVDTANLTKSQIPLGTIDSLVDFCREVQGQPKTRPTIGNTKAADILVVDEYAASSIPDDALSMASDPLHDIPIRSDQGSVGVRTPTSSARRKIAANAGRNMMGGGSIPPVVVPPVSLPPIQEAVVAGDPPPSAPPPPAVVDTD